MYRAYKYALVFFFVAGLNLVHAQKIGYLNSVTLLQEIPEVKRANSELEALQTQLQKKGEGMLQEFQRKYQELQQKEQRGELSPKQLEEEGTKLREDDAKLQQYQQDMQQQLASKRQELLQPILDNVSVKIEEVAKENGYSYILDESQGSILFKEEGMDVTSLVKAKLGI